MKRSTRRAMFAFTILAGAAALCVTATARQPRGAPAAPDRAGADDTGSGELFAVVDSRGVLRRGLHVAKVTHREPGLYEITFRRDVRGGVYLAGVGGHGQGGMPPVGYAGVEGLSTNPRSILVSTCDSQGQSVDMGFHLLVVCPPAASESPPAPKAAASSPRP